MMTRKSGIQIQKQRRPDKHDQEVGRRVRARRLERGLSQTQLAGQIGVTFQQVQKYESGDNRMGASRLEKISAALAVPISFFFDGAANVKAGKEAHALFDFAQSSDAIRLIKAYHRIKAPNVRRTFMEMCERFAEDDAC